MITSASDSRSPTRNVRTAKSPSGLAASFFHVHTATVCPHPCTGKDGFAGRESAHERFTSPHCVPARYWWLGWRRALDTLLHIDSANCDKVSRVTFVLAKIVPAK